MGRSLAELEAAYGGETPAAPAAAPAQGTRSLADLEAAYAPPEEDKPEPGLLEAGLRGAKQGLTFGFGDEITGALESAFTDKTYEESRDEARTADKAAQKAHPVGYGLAEILGGAAGTLAAPEIGALKGTGFAMNAARGAGAGLLTGAGESEADVTKEGGAEQLVKDTARSGLVGASLGGILGTAAEKYVKGAGERASKTLLSDIGDRATPTTRARLAGKGEEVVKAAREHGLDQVARNPAALVDATEAARDKVGGKISSIYRDVDALSPGVPLDDVTDALGKLELQYRSNPATKPVADVVKRQIADIHETWGAPTGAARAFIPSNEVSKFATAIGSEGFAGSGLEPKIGKIVQKKAWGAVKDLLNDHVYDVLPARAGELRALNKQYSALVDVSAAAAKRASLAKFSPTGLRNIAEGGLHGAGILASLATANPLPALATHVGIPAAKALNRGATTALAKLSAAARSGQLGPKLVQEALAAGVPRGTIEATLSAFGAGHAEEGAP